MPCPNCGDERVYRKNPLELLAYCDRCGYCWQASQAQAPILKKSFWLSKPLKGLHHIEVWYCSHNSSKYSYRTAYGQSLFNELRGEFDTPEQALQAGISEVKYG